jgi:hypothetical protein
MVFFYPYLCFYVHHRPHCICSYFFTRICSINDLELPKRPRCYTHSFQTPLPYFIGPFGFYALDVFIGEIEAFLVIRRFFLYFRLAFS